MLQFTRRIRLQGRRRLFGRSLLVAVLATLAGACGTADPVAVDLVMCESGTGPDCVEGSLHVTVEGLPPQLSAAVTVTGPNGFALELSSSSTVQLLSGEYTVRAEPVESIGTRYDPAAATQNVTIGGSGSAEVTVQYSESGTGA